MVRCTRRVVCTEVRLRKRANVVGSDARGGEKTHAVKFTPDASRSTLRLAWDSDHSHVPQRHATLSSKQGRISTYSLIFGGCASPVKCIIFLRALRISSSRRGPHITK
jgi:hypothetical protein